MDLLQLGPVYQEQRLEVNSLTGLGRRPTDRTYREQERH